MRFLFKPSFAANRANPGEMSDSAATLIIISTVFYTFLCYLMIGIEIGVLPSYVHDQLGYGSVMAGLIVSVQYISTLLTRSRVGQMSDTIGPKRTVLRGLIAGIIAASLLLLAAWAGSVAWLSLGLLLVCRLILGVAESCVGTGCITWGIGRVGSARTAQVISWNGMATYGGLAAGASVGVAIYHASSLPVLAGFVLFLAVVGWLLALRRPAVQVSGGVRMRFGAIVLRVLPHGVALACGTSGFGVIAAFITLYFGANHWDHAALSLSLFGCAFIGVRLVFGNAIRRIGGFEVACISFGVEVIGLALLWLANSAWMGVVGATLTGGGFALVFPALGVAAVTRVPPGNQGAAIGIFSAFLDLSLAISGPLAGVIVSHAGYPQVYLGSGLACVVAVLMTLWIRRDARRLTSGPDAK